MDPWQKEEKYCLEQFAAGSLTSGIVVAEISGATIGAHPFFWLVHVAGSVHLQGTLLCQAGVLLAAALRDL